MKAFNKDNIEDTLGTIAVVIVGLIAIIATVTN